MSDSPREQVSDALQIDENDRVLGVIGTAIADARAAAGLSMRELARRAKISQPFLSQVERGRTVPSLLTLYRIAGALEISPSSLMPAIGGESETLVVRADEGARLPVSDRAEAAVGRLLAAGPAHRLEVVEYRIRPGEDLGGWFESTGEMTVYVVDGALDVEIEQVGEWTLTAGDAITHPADRSHRWRPGPDGATVLLALAREIGTAQPGRRSVEG